MPGQDQRGALIVQFCVQLAFGVWIPRTLRVGKLGVKVSFKQPSSGGLMLQDLALLVFWVQVQDKIKSIIWTNF